MAVVLVVGATGILAPAAEGLRASGVDVLAVGRHGRDGAVAMDGTDAAAAAAALAGHRWDDAVVYAPAVSAETLAHLVSRTPGRVVRVLTTADAVAGALAPDTLQLGWTRSIPHRWHTPAEIAPALLRVWRTGSAEQLGEVAPASDRP